MFVPAKKFDLLVVGLRWSFLHLSILIYTKMYLEFIVVMCSLIQFSCEYGVIFLVFRCSKAALLLSYD